MISFVITVLYLFLWPIPLILAGEYFLPTWMQILIGSAAALVAGGIIWKKLLRPILDLIKLLDIALPLLRSMAEHFEDMPHAFSQLSSILREFGTDSGTTLRDVVNDLKKSAEENKTSAAVLERNLEVERRLTERRDKKIAELIESVDRMSAKQRENTKSVDRIEAGGKIVASELAAAQRRAGEVQDGEAGAAADAAAKPEK